MAHTLSLVETVAQRRQEEMMYDDREVLKAEIGVPLNCGEGHHSSKLDREQAEEIRERSRPWTDSKGVVHPAEPIRALAREYGIDAKSVRKIRDGLSWRSTGTEPISPVRAVEDDE